MAARGGEANHQRAGGQRAGLWVVRGMRLGAEVLGLAETALRESCSQYRADYYACSIA